LNTHKNGVEVIYGSFRLGNIELAINAHELQDVVNFPDEVTEVPLAPDFIIGVFSLRDAIVPVINMRTLLKHDSPRIEDNSSRDCVAVIRVDNSRLGLLFDSTSEVLRVAPSRISDFEYKHETTDHLDHIQGIISLQEGARLVQVLDPQSLINLPQVPLSSDTAPEDGPVVHTPHCRRRCITFRSGGNRFGFRIDAVSEIIPMEKLHEFHGLFSEQCLGQIELRGTRLPVLDFAMLLKEQGQKTNDDKTRIVIVKVADYPVGLRVENVEGIIEYFEDELQPLPRFGDNSRVILSGCIVEAADDISVIDHERLFKMPELTAPAQAVRESNNYSQNESDRTEEKGGTFTTYLVVNLGFDFVLPVAEVSEIIDTPETVNPIAGAPDYIDGMFNLREKVITVVNMRSLYDVHASSKGMEPKLLIVERDDQLVGLRVDGVKDIVKIRSTMEYNIPQAMMQSWSKPCREDISKNLADHDRVLPLLPLCRVLQRVAPSEHPQSADSSIAA